MVNKFPSTLKDLKTRRENLPYQEEEFYTLLDALDNNWYAWHSVNWDNDARHQSSEVDFLIFHPDYGYVVIEVKGGIISVCDDAFYSQNQRTLEQNKIKDPFTQARNSMYYIKKFYEEKAQQEPNSSELLKDGDLFPLSFNFGVYFQDCTFKDDFEYIQYSTNKIFDQTDYEEQIEWLKGPKIGPSPLERFLVNLLNLYGAKRVLLPRTAEYFINMIGANVSNYITMEKYLDLREKELETINEIQDFLLDTLSEKKRCIFKGCAGSGKTFIAMKKALRNYEQGIKTLLLCFNGELRKSIQEFIINKIDKPYNELEGLLQIETINSFLQIQIDETYHGPLGYTLTEYLRRFEYSPIAAQLLQDIAKIYQRFKYDGIIVDEAQDMDSNLWELFHYYLKDPQKSLLYIFFDESQALFVNEFSIEKFGMHSERDLIRLSRNLRNTVEIARWLEKKTTYGKYDEYSGITGFKVSMNSSPTPQDALKIMIKKIRGRYYNQGISLNRIAVLSYYKLKTLISQTANNEYCDYIVVQDKKDNSKEKMYLIEPSKISDMPQIRKCQGIEGNFLALFKTITSFKGLERDVIFLLIPNISEFKERYPERYENFLMQIYVGASRAKFKLLIHEYSW